MAKNNNKNNGIKYLQSEIDEYEEETGKKAFVAKNPTKAFKKFVDDMEVQEVEVILDENEIIEAEVEEGEDEEEEKAKEPKIDRKQIILNFMGENKKQWFSHRDFEEIGLNGRQVRPKLVKLMSEDKVEKKTEHKRNYYKSI